MRFVQGAKFFESWPTWMSPNNVPVMNIVLTLTFFISPWYETLKGGYPTISIRTDCAIVCVSVCLLSHHHTPGPHQPIQFCSGLTWRRLFRCYMWNILFLGKMHSQLLDGNEKFISDFWNSNWRQLFPFIPVLRVF